MKSLEPLLNHLTPRYERGRTLGLLFDYDGTLATIAPHPSLATLPEKTRTTLQRLVSCPRVAVGIISGRALDELQSLVAIPRTYLAGSTGLELDLQGERVQHHAAEWGMALLGQIGRSLRGVLRNYPGAWLEDKGLGLSVHYRALTRESAARLRHASSLALQPFQPNIRLLEQSSALEIMPELGWDKGTALRRILGHASVRGPDAVYVGDALNDADAMQAVLVLGGTTIGIGEHAPRISQYRLSGPAELHDFLGRLADTIERSPTFCSR